MTAPRRLVLGLAAAATAGAICPAHALLTSEWVDTASSATGYTQNQLEVKTDKDWLSAQLLVELSSGQFHYVTEGVVPDLNPTLLVGRAFNTSLTFPASGNATDPLNSQIAGFELLDNVGTGGPSGLGGSLTPVIDLDTFDLTYFGPPTSTEVSAGPLAPLILAQMTVSNDAYGTWSLRLRNADSAPADTLYASGYIFHGVFYNSQIPGDTDDDGDIDDFDLINAIVNYTGSLDPDTGGKSLADGDTDGDGDVDDFDLINMIVGYSGSLSAPAVTAVPEPGSVALLSLGGLALVRRRR